MRKILMLILSVIMVFSFAGCDDIVESDNSIEKTDIHQSTSTAKITTTPDSTSTPKITAALENSSTPENTEGNVTNSDSVKKFSIGDEVSLGDVKFNIYKIEKNNELYLLSQKNIATTTFSDSERPYDEEHNYEGSLVEGYVKKFVYGLEDKGYTIKKSGIIDKDDLYSLGFEKSVTVSGRPYMCKNTPDFVKLEKNYWLSGYYRIDTYQWVYFDEKIDTKSCDDEYGVRPIIVIDATELDKKPPVVPSALNIKEIVDSNSAWTSEGGISNPYDRYYFDCEKLIFTNVFESSQLSRTDEFRMEFIDEKTIQIEGLRNGYYTPAQLTIVSETKLRIRFLDVKYNEGDYFLNKEN